MTTNTGVGHKTMKRTATTVMTMAMTWPHDERPTTRPQPHEQLLVGWIAGGRTTTTTEGDGGAATTTR